MMGKSVVAARREEEVVKSGGITGLRRLAGDSTGQDSGRRRKEKRGARRVRQKLKVCLHNVTTVYITDSCVCSSISRFFSSSSAFQQSVSVPQEVLPLPPEQGKALSVPGGGGGGRWEQVPPETAGQQVHLRYSKGPGRDHTHVN